MSGTAAGDKGCGVSIRLPVGHLWCVLEHSGEYAAMRVSVSVVMRFFMFFFGVDGRIRAQRF